MSRSQSRGREGAVYSTGRGGAGNIRPVSRDPVARGKGPDDFSPTRGRELPAIGDTVSNLPLGLTIDWNLTLLERNSSSTLEEVVLVMYALCHAITRQSARLLKKSTPTFRNIRIPMLPYVSHRNTLSFFIYP
jgi:hypothetical protein